MKRCDTPLIDFWYLPQFEEFALLLERRIGLAAFIHTWIHWEWNLENSIHTISVVILGWKSPEWVDEGYYKFLIDIKGWPLLDIWPPLSIHCLEVVGCHHGWSNDECYTHRCKRPWHGGRCGHWVELCTTLSDVGVDMGRERTSTRTPRFVCKEW